jgi:hypothetical protein
MVRVRTKLRNKALSSASLNQTCVKSSYLDGVWLMDQRDGPEELEREIELASRISARINDPTTIERLRRWAQDLRQRLREHLVARRTRHGDRSTRASYGSKSVLATSSNDR